MFHLLKKLVLLISISFISGCSTDAAVNESSRPGIEPYRLSTKNDEDRFGIKQVEKHESAMGGWQAKKLHKEGKLYKTID